MYLAVEEPALIASQMQILSLISSDIQNKQVLRINHSKIQI